LDGHGPVALPGPAEGRPNTIVVGTGDNRQVKALVTHHLTWHALRAEPR
jgi:hypothetical protein